MFFPLLRGIEGVGANHPLFKSRRFFHIKENLQATVGKF
jgi:hypothetical protein